MVHQLQRDWKLEWANIQSDLAASQGLTQLSRAEAIQEAQKGFDERSKPEAKWAAMNPEDLKRG